MEPITTAAKPRRSSLLFISFFIILLVAGAGYYYLNTRDFESDLEPVNRSSLGFIVPENFVDTVDHPLYTLTPGTQLTYQNTHADGSEVVEYQVETRTKNIRGVAATVVIDTNYEDGERVESNEAWLAQDQEGNVWLLGEVSYEYEDGEVVEESFWITGEDGAVAGIVMKANPQPGDTYLNEFQPGEAETAVGVIETDTSVTVPYGTFDGCLKVREWSPQDTEEEYKIYCPTVGNLVYEEQVSEGEYRELIDVK